MTIHLEFPPDTLVHLRRLKTSGVVYITKVIEKSISST